MTKAFVGARPIAQPARGNSQVTRAAVEFYGPNRYVISGTSILILACVDAKDYFGDSSDIQVALRLFRRALWLGPLSEGSVPSYLNGEYPGGELLTC